jgi:hypothetical protein
MIQLGESCARDHSADLAEIPVLAETGRPRSKPQPDSPVSFHRTCQGAVINKLIVYCSDSSDSSQCSGANQNATAGGCGSPPVGTVNPVRRIQLEKEKDEGRNEHPFGE